MKPHCGLGQRVRFEIVDLLLGIQPRACCVVCVSRFCQNARPVQNVFITFIFKRYL